MSSACVLKTLQQFSTAAFCGCFCSSADAGGSSLDLLQQQQYTALQVLVVAQVRQHSVPAPDAQTSHTHTISFMIKSHMPKHHRTMLLLMMVILKPYWGSPQTTEHLNKAVKTSAYYCKSVAQKPAGGMAEIVAVVGHTPRLMP